MQDRHTIVIVGGGTAGISVAALLRRTDPDLDIALIEPSEKHYYQPLWTLVGGGIFPREDSERDEAEVIPEGVTWIKDAVSTFQPGQNRVITRGDRTVSYDFLVVAPGIAIFWDKIKGLKESVGKQGVCSNYDYETVASTWRNIQNFRGGNAIFTQPSGPVKCGGAPQKIMYLAEESFRKAGVRDKSKVLFASALPRIFQVDKYARALEEVIQRRGIETLFRHELTEIRPTSKEAVFQPLDGEGEAASEVVLPYDMIHVTPPMGPPAFVAQSPMADKEGWVDVDKYSLRHNRYPNVFGLGDASSLPTSKTGAAIRKQVPVLVENLRNAMKGEEPTASYDGYTSCPLVTGYNSLILAEFDYDKKPAESFPFDQGKERYSMFLLKKLGLPNLYWHGMLKGRA